MRLERTHLVGGVIKGLTLPSDTVELPGALFLKDGRVHKRNVTESKSLPVRSPSLYGFTSHLFTNASSAGRTGPTLSQCLSVYSDVDWINDREFFDVSAGIQLWTVPSTGFYRIVAKGASGGVFSGVTPSRGAELEGDFYLTQGERLRILVGQTGLDSTSPSAGGSTFVFLDEATDASGLLLAAGGGGGCGAEGFQDNANASLDENAHSGRGQLVGEGGQDGDAGSLSPSEPASAGAGASFTQNGAAQSTVTPALSALSGGEGGRSTGPTGSSNTNQDGGFGGGGAAHGNNYRAAGGGGGYSGGGTGRMRNQTRTMSGGGGGSYNAGENKIAFLSPEIGHGRVLISKL